MILLFVVVRWDRFAAEMPSGKIGHLADIRVEKRSGRQEGPNIRSGNGQWLSHMISKRRGEPAAMFPFRRIHFKPGRFQGVRACPS